MIDVIKIYGKTYSKASTWATQDHRPFHIAPSWGASRCPSALNPPFDDHGLFGLFHSNVPQHGCTNSSKATTQYWFVEKIIT